MFTPAKNMANWTECPAWFEAIYLMATAFRK